MSFCLRSPSSFLTDSLDKGCVLVVIFQIDFSFSVFIKILYYSLNLIEKLLCHITVCNYCLLIKQTTEQAKILSKLE